jgi:hypothetical protein
MKIKWVLLLLACIFSRAYCEAYVYLIKCSKFEGRSYLLQVDLITTNAEDEGKLLTEEGKNKYRDLVSNEKEPKKLLLGSEPWYLIRYNFLIMDQSSLEYNRKEELKKFKIKLDASVKSFANDLLFVKIDIQRTFSWCDDLTGWRGDVTRIQSGYHLKLDQIVLAGGVRSELIPRVPDEKNKD